MFLPLTLFSKQALNTNCQLTTKFVHKLIGTYIIFSHDKVIPKVINANRISPYAKMITGTTEIIATVVVLFVSTLPLTEFAEIYYKNTKYKNWGSQDWKFDMCQ